MPKSLPDWSILRRAASKMRDSLVVIGWRGTGPPMSTHQRPTSRIVTPRTLPRVSQFLPTTHMGDRRRQSRFRALTVIAIRGGSVTRPVGGRQRRRDCGVRGNGRRLSARAQEAAGAHGPEKTRGLAVGDHLLTADEHRGDGVVVAVDHARQPAVLVDALLGVLVQRGVEVFGLDDG